MGLTSKSCWVKTTSAMLDKHGVYMHIHAKVKVCRKKLFHSHLCLMCCCFRQDYDGEKKSLCSDFGVKTNQ